MPDSNQILSVVSSSVQSPEAENADVVMLHHAVQNSPIAVIITNQEGVIEYVNRHFTYLTGYEAEEALGQTPGILKSGLESEAFYKNLWQTVMRGDTWRGEIQNRSKNGTIYWGSNVIVPLRSDDESIFRYVGFSEDVTAKVKDRQKRAQLIESLRKANQQLEDSNRQKTEFVAVASHELRTPLTIIRQFLDLLNRGVAGVLNDDQQDLLGSALEGCIRLGDLVNDLLDLQKIQTGTDRARRQLCDLAPLCTQVVADFGHLFADNHITGNLELSDTRLPILGDGSMLRQVLVNLVNNSIKFTPPEGSITISAELQGEAVVIAVTDTGPGIPEEQQQGIFEVFRQCEGSQGTSDKGWGLGLSISQHLVELHGGTIELKSRPGEGATFSFRLPLFSERRQLLAVVQDTLTVSRDLQPDLTLLRINWLSDGSQSLCERGRIMSEAMRKLLRNGEDTVVQIGESASVATVVATGPEVARAKVRQLVAELAGHAFPGDVLRFRVFLLATDAELPAAAFVPDCEYEEWDLSE